MTKPIPTDLINDLRHQMASTIADFKAYDVPGLCQRPGLAEGSEHEAQIKYKYAHKRVFALANEHLLTAAQTLNDETQ